MWYTKSVEVMRLKIKAQQEADCNEIEVKYYNMVLHYYLRVRRTDAGRMKG